MITPTLYIIGIGPGDRTLLTPAALHALSQCDVVIGYNGYVEQIQDIIGDKDVIAMPLGAEMERAARAVEIAASGRCVAVVSSGDAGIYGMAGPIFQHLASIGWDGAHPAVEVIPGVSAAQAAAAALGAPLMQDFCAISLSDLLTPWDAIRRRLEAAAQSDFVIVLYNPRSRRRRKHIVEAHQIISNHRNGDTPVGIVRNACRPDQHTQLTTLAELEQRYDSIDMFTTLVIGNSSTYSHSGRMITPRGYHIPSKPTPENQDAAPAN